MGEDGSEMGENEEQMMTSHKRKHALFEHEGGEDAPKRTRGQVDSSPVLTIARLLRCYSIVSEAWSTL